MTFALLLFEELRFLSHHAPFSFPVGRYVHICPEALSPPRPHLCKFVCIAVHLSLLSTVTELPEIVLPSYWHIRVLWCFTWLYSTAWHIEQQILGLQLMVIKPGDNVSPFRVPIFFISTYLLSIHPAFGVPMVLLLTNQSYPRTIDFSRAESCGTFYSTEKSILASIHHYGTIQKSFTLLKILCILSLHSSPKIFGTTSVFAVSIFLTFLACHIARMQYAAFHISQSNTYLHFLQFVL